MFGSHRISMSSRRRAQGLEYYEDVHGEKNTAEENAEGKVDECESETDSDDEDTTTTKRKNRKGFFKPWVRDNPPTTYNARCRREVLDSASKAGPHTPSSFSDSDHDDSIITTYRIAPLQNARHSVSVTPTKEKKTKLLTPNNKFGGFSSVPTTPSAPIKNSFRATTRTSKPTMASSLIQEHVTAVALGDVNMDADLFEQTSDAADESATNGGPATLTDDDAVADADERTATNGGDVGTMDGANDQVGAGAGQVRGRPPKKAAASVADSAIVEVTDADNANDADEGEEEVVIEAVEAGPKKKGPGRPRKAVKTPVTSDAAAEVADDGSDEEEDAHDGVEAVPGRRGRPPKNVNRPSTAKSAAGKRKRVDPHKEWEIKSIIGHKTDAEGLKYQVRWVGFKDVTWEPAENFEHSLDALSEYREKVKDSAAPSTRSSLRVAGEEVEAESAKKGRAARPAESSSSTKTSGRNKETARSVTKVLMRRKPGAKRKTAVKSTPPSTGAGKKGIVVVGN